MSREVELGGRVATNRCDHCTVVRDVKLYVSASEEGGVVNFVVRTGESRFGVSQYRLDNVGTAQIIGSRGARLIICPVQGDGGGFVAGPGEIFVGADDGQDLGVVIWNSIEYSISAGAEVAHTCCGNGDVLSVCKRK